MSIDAQPELSRRIFGSSESLTDITDIIHMSAFNRVVVIDIIDIIDMSWWHSAILTMRHSTRYTSSILRGPTGSVGTILVEKVCHFQYFWLRSTMV